MSSLKERLLAKGFTEEQANHAIDTFHECLDEKIPGEACSKLKVILGQPHSATEAIEDAVEDIIKSFDIADGKAE
jgi:hypothetical protein